MLIFCESISPRLEYTLEFVFKQVLDVDYYITDDKTSFAKSTTELKLCYSIRNLGGIHVLPTNLLNETNISSRSIKTGNWNELPTIFHSSQSDVPFDIFSAIFYLISRYEEYFPSELDQHKRFKANKSIAFKNNCLQRPIINEWILELAKHLKINNESKNTFKSVITFDIDNSYSYRGKGFKRSFLGCIRDLTKFDFKSVFARISALINIKNDPSNHFNYILESFKLHNVKHHLFFILNGIHGKFDKNLSISSNLQKSLIQRLNKESEIGIHPSYQSNENPKLLSPEIDSLEKEIETPIIRSRQHFLRIAFPKTYQNLIDNGITKDYSLGYPECIGFRASTCTPFYWFDLERNEKTTLKIYPLGLMDVTLKNYLKLKPKEAISEAVKHIDWFKKFNGTFVLLWHNTSFNELEGWKGWKKVYENILAHLNDN